MAANPALRVVAPPRRVLISKQERCPLSDRSCTNVSLDPHHAGRKIQEKRLFERRRDTLRSMSIALTLRPAV